uniref:Family with sequence similarity 219 member B n=1 Tax=Cyprinus carpio TaxID=7962 RepID=A0A8C1TWJ5_CYPCA
MSDTTESREPRTRESSAALKRAENCEQTHAVEKRGPYIMPRTPAVQKPRDTARRGLLHQLRRKPRTVRFSKGYAALSQTGEDSDSDAELDCSSGYSSAEVHPDLSRQLLEDGYHLDEIPDDEDLDLIPPKALSSSVCCCCCVQ